MSSVLLEATVFGTIDDMARRSRAAALGIVMVAVGAMCLLWVSEASAQADDCPNAEFRKGTAEHLSDCRAYEMVSLADKQGVGVLATNSSTPAATHGDRLAYMSLRSFGGAGGASANSQFLASRTAAGWVTDPLVAKQSGFSNFTRYDWFSPDLAYGTMFAEADPPTLPAGPFAGMTNLYLRDSESKTFSLLTPPSGGSPLPFPVPHEVVDATADGSKVLFHSVAALTADAPNDFSTKLYLYDGTSDELRYAAILPDESPAPTPVYAGGRVYTDHSLSEDGQRYYFTTNPTDDTASGVGGRVYLRDGAGTHLISESEATTPAVPQDATYLDATLSGSRAYFYTPETLVDADDHIADPGIASGFDLYAYDATKPASAPDNLTLMSRDLEPGDGIGADPLGVLGASGDGRRVYFATAEQIVAGAPTDPGPFLYLWDDGVVRYISRLDNDPAIWGRAGGPVFYPQQSRVDDGGRYVLFASTLPLTSADNGGHKALYLYDADADSGAGSLTCVSCPADSASTSDAEFTHAAAAVTPGGSQYRVRALSDDASTVYFDTADGLVARDSNGKRDVYAYDIGTGTVSLLSTGRGAHDALFADAASDGEDVFFYTRARLAGWDGDDALDVYDARVGGGFPAPSETVPCQGDACQGTPRRTPGPLQPASRGWDGADGRPPVARFTLVGSIAGRSAVSLRIRVSRPGRLRITGTGVRSRTFFARRRGVHVVRARLTDRVRSTVRRRGVQRVRVILKVRFAPTAGPRSSRRLSIRVKG